MKKHPELELRDEGVPETTVDTAKRILKLTQASTSISVVSEFLKAKNLHFSAGSWEDLEEKRIMPALRKREINLNDLNALLAEAEEFGRSHVFLYTTTRQNAEHLMDSRHIQKTCDRLKLTRALNDVLVEELPEEPTIMQIREENSDNQRSWVFKIVEKREEKSFIGEHTEGDKYTKEWKIGFIRAVNLAKIHDSGLLEIRIQSHLSSSRYENDVSSLWTMLKDFLPANTFSELSLRKAKDKLWDKRDSLKEKIRFSNSTMRNSLGSTIVASTGQETADLFEDDSIGPSLDKFLQNGAHCDSSNIWFRPRDGILNREVHVLVSGRNNEFAVTASCARKEYEYVLNELRSNIR